VKLAEEQLEDFTNLKKVVPQVAPKQAAKKQKSPEVKK
jgi:hypothetical protein